MLFDWLLLIGGIILLIKGADFFVGGSSKIAKFLGIPSLIIGLTLVSIGTSMPEASVSVNAAISGLNDMSFSNVVGSNIFNTLLILGASSIIIPLTFDRDIKVYDIPIMVSLYALLFIFGFVVTPYKLGIIESIVLLVLFVSYIVFLILRAKKDKNKNEEKDEKINVWVSSIFTILGLAMIIFGGELVVDSASSISLQLGMSESLVGLTIVAVGTSLPELVTSVVASCKKENDIAIGNVVGSNIFNIIFILGFSSTISPLVLNSQAWLDVVVMLVSGVLLLSVVIFSKNFKRWQGVLFVSLYISYLIFIICRN